MVMSAPHLNASSGGRPAAVPNVRGRISWSNAYDHGAYPQQLPAPPLPHSRGQQQHHHQQHLSESASMSFGGLSDALSDSERRIEHGHPHHGFVTSSDGMMDDGPQDRHRYAGANFSSSSLMSMNSLSEAAASLEEAGEGAARRIFGHGGGQYDRPHPVPPYHPPAYGSSPPAWEQQRQRPAPVVSAPPSTGVGDRDADCLDMSTIQRQIQTVGTGDMLESVQSIGTFDMQSVQSHPSFGNQAFHPRNMLTNRTMRTSDVETNISKSNISSISGLTGSQINEYRKPSSSFASDPYGDEENDDDDFITSNRDDDDQNTYASSTMPGHITLLAIPEDVNALNELQCFIRQNVQVFSATPSDVDKCLQARKRIAPGQVGMRCIHCARLPPRTRAEQAVSYPPSVANIYQRVLIMGQVHFEACPAVPQDVAERFRVLKATTSRVRFSRKYWIQAAERIGMVDSGDGIRFRDGGAPVSVLQDRDGVADAGRACEAMGGDMRHRTLSDVPLVTEPDRPLITDFQFVLMQQMQACRFTESDTNKHGRRTDIKEGFAGLECRHCEGRGGLGKYFPVNAKRLREPRTHSAFTSHILKCTKCPQEMKTLLSTMQKKHSEQSTRLRRGSQKEFFERVWERLHNEEESEESDEDEEMTAGGNGDGALSRNSAALTKRLSATGENVVCRSAQGKGPSVSTWTR